MKILPTILIGLLTTIVSCTNSQTDKTNSGSSNAQQELENALANKTEKQVLVDTVISDKKTATEVAESILFKIYGKDNIIEQRPYEVNFVKGYWILNGTLPKGMLGGTFFIIIKATDGQIIKLTHGK